MRKFIAALAIIILTAMIFCLASCGDTPAETTPAETTSGTEATQETTGTEPVVKPIESGIYTVGKRIEADRDDILELTEDGKATFISGHKDNGKPYYEYYGTYTYEDGVIVCTFTREKNINQLDKAQCEYFVGYYGREPALSQFGAEAHGVFKAVVEGTITEEDYYKYVDELGKDYEGGNDYYPWLFSGASVFFADGVVYDYGSNAAKVFKRYEYATYTLKEVNGVVYILNSQEKIFFTGLQTRDYVYDENNGMMIKEAYITQDGVTNKIVFDELGREIWEDNGTKRIEREYHGDTTNNKSVKQYENGALVKQTDYNENGKTIYSLSGGERTYTSYDDDGKVSQRIRYMQGFKLIYNYENGIQTSYYCFFEGDDETILGCTIFNPDGTKKYVYECDDTDDPSTGTAVQNFYEDGKLVKRITTKIVNGEAVSTETEEF